MKRVAVSLLLMWCIGQTTGCGTASPKPVRHRQPLTSLLDDGAFANTPDLPTPKQIFELDVEIRQRAAEAYARKPPNLSDRAWFVGWIREVLSTFDYAAQTGSANQTWYAKRGNCLSLAILTAALARELGLAYRFQELIAPPSRDRQQGVMLVNKHVNVWISGGVVAADDAEYAVDETGATVYTSRFRFVSVIDFFPSSRDYPSDMISSAVVVANFYSNQAAEAFVDKQYNRTYWTARQALFVKPDHLPAWNVLGLVYARTGHQLAESVYRHALALFPTRIDQANLSTMNNLAVLLERQNRPDEARTLRRRIHNLTVLKCTDEINPFYFYDRAEVALKQKNFRRAAELYRKAIKRDPYQHEFFFGLFKAYWMLGNHHKASVALKRAVQTANDDQTTLNYRRKLVRLKGAGIRP